MDARSNQISIIVSTQKMFKVENLQFSSKSSFSKTEGDGGKRVWRIRVKDDILYKNHPVDIAEQKKSFILLDCVVEIRGESVKEGVKYFLIPR